MKALFFGIVMSIAVTTANAVAVAPVIVRPAPVIPKSATPGTPHVTPEPVPNNPANAKNTNVSAPPVQPIITPPVVIVPHNNKQKCDKENDRNC